MCGIWGFVGEREAVALGDAWTGLCSLTDRGPDDWGMYVSGQGKVTQENELGDAERSVVLGNRRLSILDLSAAGNQPMVADDRYWLVYNGEVYNYRELRTQLRDAGYAFESDTDTEVVLRAYQEWGADCVDHFRGMFAFAVWDAHEASLFAARDRFGIKPFYYDADGDRLAFASELTALLEAGVSARRLDSAAVDGFLTFGSVPAPRTIVDGVRSLPPGSTLAFEPGDDAPTVERYWHPSFGDDGDATPEGIRELLAESVALRLRSDVPVGAFLSGGLDSSAVVALMQAARESDEALHTCSIGFDHEAYSETSGAERVADAFGTEHTTRTVTAGDVREALPDVVAAMDQPTVDGVNTYFVSQLAAEEGLRVALSGLGSDELFHGYPSFRLVPTLHAFGRVTAALPGPVGRGLAELSHRLGAVSSRLPLTQVADVFQSRAPFGGAYVAVRGLFSTAQRRRLLEAQEPTDWTERVQATADATLREATVGDAVSHAELAWYMHNQLLRDTDVMSMSHSLEVRVPFLDGPFAEHVASIDPDRKREGDKQLLKDALADDLPEPVTDREKSGFTFPFAEWLDDELAPVVERALAEDRLARTPLDPAAVRDVRERFRAGDAHWSRLWAVVVLSLWIEEHVAVEDASTASDTPFAAGG